jgi:hypothetical protein
MDLSTLASILFTVTAPIVIIASLAFVMARVLRLEARTLSRLTLYLFTPALLFGSMYRSKLGSEFLEIVAFAFVVTVLMGIITWVMVRVMRYDRLTASAFALSVLFVNAGNYGLPLVLFAFGEEGLARAVVFFTVSAILTQTLAVFIAAGGKASVVQALKNVFTLPLVYAVTLGLIFNVIGFTVPEPIVKSLDLLGSAAVPCMLAILGIELAHASLNRDRLNVGLATVAKLGIAPLIAFALAALMGLDGVTRAVCIVESSMPTAVTASIVAIEFDSRPEFVTSVVLLSTIGSVLSLTLLIGVLR